MQLHVKQAIISFCILFFIAGALHGESQAKIKFRSKGSVASSIADGSIVYRGPVSGNYGKWKFFSSGDVRVFISRILKKKSSGGEMKHKVEPELRSVVAVNGIELVLGDELKLSAKNLVWLNEKKVMRALGRDIILAKNDTTYKSVDESSVVTLTIDGEIDFEGEWNTILK